MKATSEYDTAARLAALEARVTALEAELAERKAADAAARVKDAALGAWLERWTVIVEHIKATEPSKHWSARWEEERVKFDAAEADRERAALAEAS